MTILFTTIVIMKYCEKTVQEDKIWDFVRICIRTPKSSFLETWTQRSLKPQLNFYSAEVFYMFAVISDVKTESQCIWMSYKTKHTSRHHRISQHLQVSCHLVNILNLNMLMNLKLKCVPPRLILHTIWKHTSRPGATGMLLFH